ncbi:hypothetical protein J6590_099123 [Homalodisca vitripennis]|nr:hypothetical protein J6590_099123 [Homalodisca vitripennis]
MTGSVQQLLRMRPQSKPTSLSKMNAQFLSKCNQKYSISRAVLREAIFSSCVKICQCHKISELVEVSQPRLLETSPRSVRSSELG